jgi:hypothetical protein
MVEESQHLSRERGVEVVGDLDQAAHRAELPRRSIAIEKDEPGDWLATSGNDDLFAAGGALHQSGQMRFCLVDIHLAHGGSSFGLDLAKFSRRPWPR